VRHKLRQLRNLLLSQEPAGVRGQHAGTFWCGGNRSRKKRTKR
jgi:hypothetical protein